MWSAAECHDLTLEDDEDEKVVMSSDDKKLPAAVTSKTTTATKSTTTKNAKLHADGCDGGNDDDDDDDDDLVEVLSFPPTVIKTNNSPPFPAVAAVPLVASKPRPSLLPTADFSDDDDDDDAKQRSKRPKITFLDSFENDDSDDELLIIGGPTFSNRNHLITAAKVTANVNKTTSSHVGDNDDDDNDDNTSDSDLDDLKPKSRKLPPPSTVSTKETTTTKASSSTAAAAKIKTNNTNPYSQSSKDDRAEQRRLDKIKRDEQKKQEQILKQQQRQLLKQQREQSRLEERDAKRRHVDAMKQQQGKYAAHEICVLLDPSFLRGSSSSSSTTSLTATAAATANQQWMTTYVTELRKTYMVQEYHSALGAVHAIQWIRQDHANGGAAGAWQALQQRSQSTNNTNDNNNNSNIGFEHLDRLLLVFHQPDEFLQLLDRSGHGDEDDDDYPKLETWLMGVQAGWQAAWCRHGHTNSSTSKSPLAKKPRIVLLLHQVREELDRKWKAYSKIPKRQRDLLPQPPTDAELEDAMTWMLIRFQVECVVCSNDLDMMDQIQKMTRALSERPYRLQVTELECIKKLKSGLVEDDTATATTTNPYAVATRLARAKDTWMRQLQQIPHISEKKATNLARHYPTALSLWQVYHPPPGSSSSLSVEDKRHLVAELLTPGRQEIKLSDAIYRIMTSMNPQEMI